MFKSKNLNHVVRRAVYLVLTLAIAMSCFLIPASAASHPFTDVKDKDWFSGSVEWVYANGCMNGTSATRFSPNQGMTRAMLVTVLWRMDGGWRPLNGVPFEDIKPDEYPAEAQSVYGGEALPGLSRAAAE